MRKDGKSGNSNNNRNNSKAYSKDEFFKDELGIKSPTKLKNAAVMKMARIKLKKMDPDVLKKYLELNVELIEPLKEIIKSLSSTITNIKENQKVRWEFAKASLNNPNITGEQIIDILKIIQELEIRDNEIMTTVIDGLKKFGQAILVVAGITVLGILGKDSIGGKNKKSTNKGGRNKLL